jgi:hypothetical protein
MFSGTIAGSMRLQLGDDLIVRLHDHRILRGLRLHDNNRDSCVGFASMIMPSASMWVEGRAMNSRRAQRSASRVLIRTELVIGQARDKAQVAFNYVRQLPARPDL